MIRHWNRLPKEQVETQSVEAFERCVDVALREMAQRWGSVGQTDGWRLDDLAGLFQPR